ncbi:MAG: PAS domain-containing protein [Candidatus Colwellbacteria bacterium]|nr:PAS domain-containing protein [Candidatus Colwellbacteria bacterium]
MQQFFRKNGAWLFSAVTLALIAAVVWYVPRSLAMASAVVLALLGASAVYLSRKIPRPLARVFGEQQQLAEVLANVREGILVYDTDFTVHVMNRAAEEMFSLSASDLVGRELTLKLKDAAPENLRALLTLIYPALAPRVVRRTESGVYPQVMDISLDAPQLELRVATNPIENEQGVVTGYLKIIEDRTRELQLLKEKGEFVTVASHQLRTPLTGINWALQGLAGDTLTNEQRQIVADARANVNRALKVVEDLLDVARIEEGRFGYEFQTVSLVSLIGDALKQAEPVATSYNVSLFFNRPTGEVAVYADVGKLGIVLANLLDNAIKYNVKNGQVTVSIEQSGEDYAHVSVADSGIGIPEDAQGKLFTRFFRAENASKTNVEGTGLGLYIARNIIKRHGGKMWIASEENRGTTAHFTLATRRDVVPEKEFIYGEDA